MSEMTSGAWRVPEFNASDRLRKARESAGLEQSELADAIGVSRGTIGNAERGTVTPRKITLKAWALATGVPLEWLETGNAPQPDRGPGGGGADLLPRLDSNQQPSGKQTAGTYGTVIALPAAA